MKAPGPDEFEACVWHELAAIGADRHARASTAVAVIVAMARYCFITARPHAALELTTRELAEQVRAAIPPDDLAVIVNRREAAAQEACP